ncbi:MAG: tRNA (N6-isopentenyl adenosine(37)-C2)-methylthiotransferase MiaB [Candidatus Omnitrophica bacterium]|nr:tRNA (N6-isopentenyl adenosine(37)-C2)-methylthiotransferase MiaB [Candidatus Omnitrophota bacterium]
MDKKCFYLRTFGCQMNIRDSEVIAGLLTAGGYRITDEPDEADVIILNTCSVRQHAEDKVWSQVNNLSKLRITKDGHTPLIGIVGCMAQNHKERIFERAPQVDFVVGPSDIQRIPEIIKKLSTIDHRLSAHGFLEKKIWETDGGVRPEEIYHTGFYGDKEHAYVVISEGCSNFCSYCVVPYVRGTPRNRNYKDITREIEEALDKGITRFTLLGQNVNAYQCDGVDFTKLVSLVNSVKGLKEFTFLTSHPKDTTISLFKAMADNDKLRKDLHLPIQSGSDRILEMMNRGYNRKFYLDLTDNYRRIVKGGTLTTDIILGFPTETESDFGDTYKLLENVRFNAAYIFKYSPRPNTAAAGLRDDVAKEEKEKRHALILELQRMISKSKK